MVLAEKHVRGEHERLATLFEQAPSFMAVLRGPEYRIEIANPAYMQLIGHRQVLGRTVAEALPEAVEQGYLGLLDQVYASGKAYSSTGAQYVVQPVPGGPTSERFVNFVYQPIVDADGKVTGIFLEGVDVTDHVQARLELQEASRRKDEFLAMLAHELRNPLAPIAAAAALLQMAKLDDPRVHRTSEIIGRQVEHMTHLIDDLLDVSRVTRGLVKLNTEPLDIRHVVAEAVEQVTPLIQSRRHQFSLHMQPDSTVVNGDKKRLVQVLTNILNNAVKYTNEGGNILLRTDTRGSQVVIEVIDDGIGMAPDLVEHAFDLFAQAERSSDRSAGGLGVGLALVTSLVELHDGTASCESDGLGKGSKFTVSLPRFVEAIREDKQSSLDGLVVPSSRKLRIMVVDDNKDAAAMLAMLLEALGHDVIVAHSSQRALELAGAELPEVYLLDIGLPQMDGNELARRLRAKPETAKSVLVAITGYGQENDRKDAIAAGFDHHLVKPVDTKRLALILAGIGKA